MRVVAICLVGLALSACDQTSGLYGNDEMSRYTQRLDAVTDSLGDANRRNIALHTNQPAPAYAYDHRIPVDANITGRAVDCMRKRSVAGNKTTTDTAVQVAGGTATANSHSVTEPKNDCK